MSNSIPVPEDILSFTEQNIDCTEQLEILRILADDPEKLWGVAALATKVQAPPPLLLGYLRALQSRGLLSPRQRGEETLWQHGSSSEQMRTMVSRLLQTYRERPVTMIRMVYTKKAKMLEAFSDAFRLS